MEIRNPNPLFVAFCNLKAGDVFKSHSQYFMVISPIQDYNSKTNAVCLENGRKAEFTPSAEVQPVKGYFQVENND